MEIRAAGLRLAAMNLKAALYRNANAVLVRTAGYQLTRPPGHISWRLPPPREGRMLKTPVFVLSTPRSGSTLTRAILGSHSALYAPPEIHLAHLRIQAETPWIRASLDALKVTVADLEHMTWDCLLADALTRSGKPTIVVKTPSNVLIWERVLACWPDAQFIFLLRHPAAAVASLHASFDPAWQDRETGTAAEAVAKIARYARRLEEARRAFGASGVHALTMTYEELTAEPEAVTRRLCEFLHLPYEATMLDYGRFAAHHFSPGLGDASEKIRSGRIQPPIPLPATAEIPAELRDVCAAWGYLNPAETGPTPRPGPEPSAMADGPALGHKLATSACLARTASAAVRRSASSDSVRSRATIRRTPALPISASTPR
jgi:LPS sulfotransferase NodH